MKPISELMVQIIEAQHTQENQQNQITSTPQSPELLAKIIQN